MRFIKKRGMACGSKRIETQKLGEAPALPSPAEFEVLERGEWTWIHPTLGRLKVILVHAYALRQFGAVLLPLSHWKSGKESSCSISCISSTEHRSMAAIRTNDGRDDKGWGSLCLGTNAMVGGNTVMNGRHEGFRKDVATQTVPWPLRFTVVSYQRLLGGEKSGLPVKIWPPNSGGHSPRPL